MNIDIKKSVLMDTPSMFSCVKYSLFSKLLNLDKCLMRLGLVAFRSTIDVAMMSMA